MPPGPAPTIMVSKCFMCKSILSGVNMADLQKRLFLLHAALSARM
jgi:hypothetical protein